MLFICYSKCTTCKKAEKWLDEYGIRYESRDIKENNPTYTELKNWIYKSQKPIKKFFNASGNAYKALNLKEKLPAMGEEEALNLLASDGMLVKRPLLVGDGFVLAGFSESEWENTVLKENLND